MATARKINETLLSENLSQVPHQQLVAAIKRDGIPTSVEILALVLDDSPAAREKFPNIARAIDLANPHV